MNRILNSLSCYFSFRLEHKVCVQRRTLTGLHTLDSPNEQATVLRVRVWSLGFNVGGGGDVLSPKPQIPNSRIRSKESIQSLQGLIDYYTLYNPIIPAVSIFFSIIFSIFLYKPYTYPMIPIRTLYNPFIPCSFHYPYISPI